LEENITSEANNKSLWLQPLGVTFNHLRGNTGISSPELKLLIGGFEGTQNIVEFLPAWLKSKTNQPTNPALHTPALEANFQGKYGKMNRKWVRKTSKEASPDSKVTSTSFSWPAQCNKVYWVSGKLGGLFPILVRDNLNKKNFFFFKQISRREWTLAKRLTEFVILG
jgi:hypothetical protein